MIKKLSLKLSLILAIIPTIFAFLATPHYNFRSYVASIMTASIIFTTALLMYKTGKFSLFRKILFSAYAIIFAFYYIHGHMETMGHMYFTEADFILNRIETCAIPIPSLLLSAFMSGKLIFPGYIDTDAHTLFRAFSGKTFLWILFTLSIGKGWCSWGCYFGGFTDFFASLLKKPVITVNPDHIFIKWTPYILTFIFVSLPFFILSPFFCTWVCPFKCTTKFIYPTNLISWSALIIAIIMFLTTVVILPLLTKKRTFCHFICPLGVVQSFVGKLSVFRIKYSPDKCISCMKCVKACTFANITAKAIINKKNVPGVACTLCGECVNVCPTQALYPGLIFQPKEITKKQKNSFFQNRDFPAILFTFNAYFFLAIMIEYPLYTLVMTLLSLTTMQ